MFSEWIQCANPSSVNDRKMQKTYNVSQSTAQGEQLIHGPDEILANFPCDFLKVGCLRNRFCYDSR